MKNIRYALTGLCLTVFSLSAASGPAMSVLTVNTENPMRYAEWTMEHGAAIGASIDASVGGACIATTGYYQPGEVYYWHLFDSHQQAMAANPYNPTVQKALANLDIVRTVSQADAYSVVLGEPNNFAVGDQFANWNLIISTDVPSVYLEQVSALSTAAKANGFEDVSMAAYAYLSGEHAGKLLVVAQAPTGARLGAFLDNMSSSWAAPIMAKVSQIRDYDRGFTMNCSVTYVR